MIQLVFWMALKVSFDNLLATLIKFSNFSGHKINFSKSDAIWIGAKKGSQTFPFSDLGLTRKINHFKTLGTYTFLLKLGPCLILTIRPS